HQRNTDVRNQEPRTAFPHGDALLERDLPECVTALGRRNVAGRDPEGAWKGHRRRNFLRAGVTGEQGQQYACDERESTQVTSRCCKAVARWSRSARRKTMSAASVDDRPPARTCATRQRNRSREAER